MLGLVLIQVIFKYRFLEVDAMIVEQLNFSARVATYLLTFCVNFPIGFLLSSYVVFPESQIHGRVQLFRYSLATLTFLLLGFVLTQVFKIIVPFIPAGICNIFVALIFTFLSYLSQRFFTFKITPEAAETPTVEETEM